MLFLLPPAMVPLCVAIGLLVGNAATYLKRQEHPERALVVVASSWNAVGGALVIALAGEPDAAWSVWPVLLAAVLAQFAFDFLGSAARAWVAFGIAPKAHVRLMAWVYGVDLALTPIALLTAIVAEEQPLALLVVLPLLALLAFLAQERRRRIDHALELGHAYRGTAFLLGDVIEADDEYTGNHSREVVSLTLAVADRLGLSARQRRSAELTALLHDVGKIRIPAEIINKPAALTAEERAVINTHTIEGERMLERVGGLLGEVGRLVRSCHERWDGQGYPDGLAGEDIPLVARIVCCCDAYNAMTTDRPYRAAAPCGRGARRGGAKRRHAVRPSCRPSSPRSGLAQQARETAVLEDPPLGLAARAVVDRVLLEVDARERRAALRARLVEAVVHAVDLLVGGAALAELEAARELLLNGVAEPLHLFLRELRGERVRREPRVVEDLVRPGPADPGDQPLVA